MYMNFSNLLFRAYLSEEESYYGIGNARVGGRQCVTFGSET